MDEREAIDRLKRGDISGLELLVRTYQVAALRTASLITRDRSLAEDVVQSAFLVAFERIGQFDPNRPFGPWFLRSVVNGAIKAASRRQREVSLEDNASGETFWDETLADPDPAPDELLEAAETHAAVWSALGCLPPAQRAAIVQRYYLGWSEAEMVERLRWPRTTVKWRLYAARRRLRLLLHALAPVRGREDWEITR